MKRYDSYKDSGVQWIREIPSHWNVCAFKRFMTINNGSDYKHIVSDEGFPVIGSGGPFATASQYMYDGEVVMLGRKGTIDKPLYFNGKFWAVDTMFYAVPSKEANCRFMYYLALTFPFNYYSTATALPSMTQTDLGNNPVAVPDLVEQTAIANYLDNKCCKIDNVITTQEKRVELLRELKQSIITRAVTRGINPNAKMKDSGVEWIGEIPEHWIIMRLNELGKYKKGPFGSALKVTMFVEKGADTIKVYQQQNAINKNWKLGDDYIEGSYYREAMRGFTVEPGDIIVSCAGTIGECYIMPNDAEKGIINQALMKMKMDESKVNLNYFLLLFDIMLKEESAKSSNGSAMKNIPPFDVMKKMLIPLPSLDEQNKILTNLTERLNRLDSSITKALRQIELLKEYKQSLITEVVTGKRKVC